jgi:hypothetical protein
MRKLSRSAASVALVLASLSALVLAPPRPTALAAVAGAEPFSTADLAAVDLHYALRATSFDDMALPAGFTAPRIDVFQSDWRRYGASGSGYVQVDLSGPHAEQGLLYILDDNVNDQRRNFNDVRNATDVSDRLRTEGLPYPASCSVDVSPGADNHFEARPRCAVLVEKVLVSAFTLDTADAKEQLAGVTFDDVLALVIKGLEPLRTAADSVRHGVHPPSAQESLATARKLYDALLVAPIEESELPEGIASATLDPEERLRRAPNEKGDAGMVTFDVKAGDGEAQLTYWIYPAALAQIHFQAASYENTVFTSESHPTEFEHPTSCLTFKKGTAFGGTHCEALIDPVSVGAESNVRGDVDRGDDALVAAILRLGIAHLDRVKAIASR